MEEMVPTHKYMSITTETNPRRERLCIIPKHKGCGKILTTPENSQGVRGPKLFNTLPKYIFYKFYK